MPSELKDRLAQASAVSGKSKIVENISLKVLVSFKIGESYSYLLTIYSYSNKDEYQLVCKRYWSDGIRPPVHEFSIFVL